MSDVSPESKPTATGSPASTPTSDTTSAPTHSRKVQLKGMSYEEGQRALKPAVQMHGGGDGSGADVHAVAERGMSGGGGQLPYLETIQRSFGKHDVSGVKAHTGSAASQASAALGATAYASGENTVFAGSPDLHTTVHEATHVVQQRAGVQLDGGVGKTGDRYEQHADAVADAVVRGQSAEPLLDAMAGGAGGGVQRQVQKKGQPGNATELNRSLSLQSLGVDGLSALLSVLREPGSIGIGIDVGVKVSLAKIIEIGAKIGISGSLSMSDDRRFRATGSVGLTGYAGIDLGLWDAKVSVSRTWSVTGVFQDERHFAAYICQKIADLVSGIRKYVQVKAAEDKKQLSAADRQSLAQQTSFSGANLGRVAPGRVDSVKTTVKGEGGSTSTGGTRVEVEGSKTTSTFHRQKNGVEQINVATTKEFGVSLSGGPWKAGFTASVINNHAVPDNDGTYLNIKITRNTGLGGKFQTKGFVNKLASGVMNLPIPQAGGLPLGTLASSVMPKLGEIITSTASGTSTESYGANAGVEVNFVKSNGIWACQYSRVIMDMQRAQEADIPIAGPITGTVGGSVSANFTLAEFAGTQTLTYFQTVYNGFMNRGQRGVAHWNQWLGSHGTAFWKAMCAVAKPGTAAHAEASASLKSAVAPHAAKLNPSRRDNGVYSALRPTFESEFRNNNAAALAKVKWRDKVPGRVHVTLDLANAGSDSFAKSPVHATSRIEAASSIREHVEAGADMKLTFVDTGETWSMDLKNAKVKGALFLFQNHYSRRFRKITDWYSSMIIRLGHPELTAALAKAQGKGRTMSYQLREDESGFYSAWSPIWKRVLDTSLAGKTHVKDL